MGEDTKKLWEFARVNNIEYDTVMVALEMVEFDPKQDIYGILMSPTDAQKMTLRSKLMGIA